MTEQESNLGPIEGLIRQIESGERPIDKYLGKSLRELFFSGAYRLAILSGTSDPSERMIFEAVRIVGKRNNRLQSLTFSMSPNKNTTRRQLDTMLEATRKIPVNSSGLTAFSAFQDDALDALENANLQTIAAMQISRSVTSRKEIVQVNYPRVFMNLMPVPEPFRQDLGLGIATYFLKTVPFGKGNIDITIPSH